MRANGMSHGERCLSNSGSQLWVESLFLCFWTTLGSTPYDLQLNESSHCIANAMMQA